MIPYAPDAERATLAAMLSTRPDREAAIGLLQPDDFHDVTHRAIFVAIVELHEAGERVEPLSVATRAATTTAAVRGLFPELPVAPLAAYRILADLGQRRRIIGECHQIAEVAHRSDTDIGELLQRAAAMGDRTALSDLGADAVDVAQLAHEEHSHDWIVPSLLEAGDRLILTGGEGTGKSVALRSWALMLSAGVHPFTQAEIAPVRVLLVDLENSRAQLGRWFREYLPRLRAHQPGQMKVWAKIDGLDVRNARDAQHLSAQIETHRAELVVIGPLYKAFRVRKGESKNDETAAEEAAYSFDRLRSRHGCALWIEAHSPHGDAGDRSGFRPYGASLWLRWPEFGFGLKAVPDSITGRRMVEMRPWRGVRERGRDWPERLVEGGTWPWMPA